MKDFSHTTLFRIGAGIVCACVLMLAGYTFKQSTPIQVEQKNEPEIEYLYFSGVVVPQERIVLAFERPGKITSVRYNRGAHVTRGATLATIDAATARANLARAQALVDTEVAQLDILVRGATTEERELEEAKVTQAEQSVHNAHTALQTSLGNAFTTASNAIYSVSDELFDNPRTNIPVLKYTVPNVSLKIQSENERLALGDTLTKWSNYNVFDQTISSQELLERVEFSRNSLLLVRAFLENLASYTALLSGQANISESTIATWQANISNARTAVQQTLTTLDAAHEKLQNTIETLRVTKAQQKRITAQATAEDIRLQDARVAAARADVLAQESVILQHSITAPASGTIIDKHKNIGELVSASEPVFTLDTGSVYEIEGRISELDLVRLQKGMHATVTFDALGEAQFQATIIRIDSAERAIGADEGYGITLRLVSEDVPIQAGMTANISVPLYYAQ